MTVTATSDDYETYTGDPAPAGVDGKLRSASRLVARDTRFAVYDVDTTGDPTDAAVLQAMIDAACEQVVSWIAAGVDPAAGGIVSGGIVSSKSIDGKSVSYDNSLNASVTAFTARREMGDTLCSQAQLILTQAGLVANVRTYG